jgi:hypothetical protein
VASPGGVGSTPGLGGASSAFCLCRPVLGAVLGSILGPVLGLVELVQPVLGLVRLGRPELGLAPFLGVEQLVGKATAAA